MTRPIHNLTLPAIVCAVLGAPGVLNAESPAAPGLDRPLALSETAADLQWGDCPSIFPPGCKISVLHGNPAEPGADVFLRVPPGYTIPAHSHTSAERMVLVQGEMQVTYEGHKPVTLKRGSYAYGPAELVHEASCLSADPCVLFIAFEQPLDAIPMKMAAAKAAEAKAATETKKKSGGC